MKAEKTRDFLRYYHPYNNSVSNREKIIEDREKDGALEELAELERLADVGRATEMFLSNEMSHGRYCEGYMQRGLRTSTRGIVVTSPHELLEWHRAQEDGAK